MENDFIALPKNITESDWYQDASTFKLFIHLLLKGEKSKIQYGSSIIDAYKLETTISQLSYEAFLSENQVQETLNKLINLGEILTLNSKKGILVIMNNYSIYKYWRA
jgi:hypothetical protein